MQQDLAQFGLRLRYMRDGHDSTAENATEAHIAKIYEGYHTLLKFELPRQKSDLERFGWIVCHVFERGKQEARFKMREALGL